VTLKLTLSHARQMLAANNTEDASLKCELLLRHALKLSRAELYLDMARELSPEKETEFWQMVRRHRNGEPTAYITGHREFYGIDFHVDCRVLIPRPESELLVTKALALMREHAAATIAEIGTGCGAIAISLALSLPEAKIYATDISAPALEVALFNCEKHGLARRVCLLQGDMLAPLPEPVNLIIANLPYVRASELDATSFEPMLALNGGRDGLDKIRRLCRQLSDRLLPGGHLLLEIGQGQRKAVTAFLRSLFPSAEIEVTPDLSGIDRVLSLSLPTTT